MAEREIQFHRLFWETLAEYRGTPKYAALRRSILDFVKAKALSFDPVSGHDRPFTGNELRGVWHCVVGKADATTLFYTIDGPVLHLAMVGSHNDYSYNGNQFRRDRATATRIANTLAVPAVDSPGWPDFRWRTPTEVMEAIELPELSDAALARIEEELVREQEDYARFERHTGRPLLDAPEDEAYAYMDAVERALHHVSSLRNTRFGAHHWLRTPYLGAETGVPPKPIDGYTDAEIARALRASPRLREMFGIQESALGRFRPDYDWRGYAGKVSNHGHRPGFLEALREGADMAARAAADRAAAPAPRP